MCCMYVIRYYDVCPLCATGRSCDQLQCVNNGQCVDYYGNQLCVCPHGYHGKHCEEGKVV